MSSICVSVNGYVCATVSQGSNKLVRSLKKKLKGNGLPFEEEVNEELGQTDILVQVPEYQADRAIRIISTYGLLHQDEKDIYLRSQTA